MKILSNLTSDYSEKRLFLVFKLILVLLTPFICYQFGWILEAAELNFISYHRLEDLEIVNQHSLVRLCELTIGGNSSYWRWSQIFRCSSGASSFFQSHFDRG